MIVALHKPYGYLSQFTPEPGSQWRTLAEFKLPPNIYPIGRLDADSEGLLLLSDERAVIDRLLDPRHRHPREYHVQVENIPAQASLLQLSNGVKIGDYQTLPCTAKYLNPVPDYAARNPPIRVRKSVPDCWISIVLTEGKNRQVRRMTAAVGHPTLRLIRARIGALKLADLHLPMGRWVELTLDQRDTACESV